MAYKKESWINNKRHYKRHIRNQWMHGHAARAVDGDYDQTLHRLVGLSRRGGDEAEGMFWTVFTLDEVWLLDAG